MFWRINWSDYVTVNGGSVNVNNQYTYSWTQILVMLLQTMILTSIGQEHFRLRHWNLSGGCNRCE